MSITSEELNYLIWRYLQEAGHEVSALAMQEETRVLEFDEKYKEHIPLGTLVKLVQKGILYTESEFLVQYNAQSEGADAEHYGKDFNLVQALEVDKQRFPELVAQGRFALAHEREEPEAEPEVTRLESDDSFIKTLQCVQTFPPGYVSQWNPKHEGVFAYGERDSRAAVVTYSVADGLWNISETVVLPHANTGQQNEVTCLEWAPGGQSLLTGVESGELRLWSVEGKLQNILSYHRAPIVCIKWNSDETHVLTCDADNMTIVWNVLSGTAVQHFSFKEAGTEESLGVDATWIDQDKFAIPGIQGSILVFNIGISKPIGKLRGHSKTLTTIAYNEHNKLLLSASDDNTLRVWRGGNLNPSHVFYGHSQSITSAHWVDDDTIISTSMDGSIRVWSLASNSTVASATVDGVPNFTGALSPDQGKFATGTLDGEVMVYDIQKLLQQLNHNGYHGTARSAEVARIPVVGDHRSAREGNYVTQISWSQESTQLSVSYSLGDINILSVD
ncbi:ADL322Cp [Eremothecium gossypii ATCC 10895]|uniref:ADL322Cp n=1 Tax=Eremothecium gossypii (strain ATCC 10895 / CBS 109.51 / FGSC 9923 / NRRL Y-1056) TaxID=284811 RepID=Q75B92_EREGS|nr:ADL322Cp [Eremothecium gossypii ATCC 10895]AAS51598.2 ADL322Cp [Eremothecium gossypii ATCC 10895]AEY95894.1 FADL322Cp [Eremothecium gossypii FDAG1]